MVPARSDEEAFLELPLAAEAETSEADLDGTSSSEQTRERRRFSISGRVIAKALLVGLSSAAVAILALPYANAYIWHPLFRGSHGAPRGDHLGGVVSLNSDLQGEAMGMPGMPVAKGELGKLRHLDVDELENAAMGMPGIPTANLDSGDACKEGEELFMKLCFKKCSSFHDGHYPKRRLPFVCCQDTCDSFSCCRSSLPIPGHGYFSDVDGGVPHIAGSCDSNEEHFMGLCYKTCSALTDDEFPRRVGANSCCKPEPNSCLNVVFNVKTEGLGCNGYGVGGELEADHKCPHPPTIPESQSD